MRAGTWDSATSAPLGNQGGPVALFNATSLTTVVVSAASNFMVGGLAFPSWAGPKALSGGLFAALTGVPADTVHTTILVAGDGIGDTMRSWGDALLTLGGKARTPLQRDPQTALLSYWTDNGGASDVHAGRDRVAAAVGGDVHRFPSTPSPVSRSLPCLYS